VKGATRTSIIAVCVGVATLIAVPAQAKPGRLDHFFSGDGHQTAFASGASGYAVALDDQERIVVAGYTLSGNTNIALVRLLPNGTFDPDFGGGDGRVVTNLGATDYGFDVAIPPDGGIVVAGERVSGSGSRMALLRYGPKGRLDKDFGGGDGVVLTSFGKKTQGASAVVVGASGNITIGGYTSNGGTSRFALARYGPRGVLDRDFGRKGLVTTDLTAAGEGIKDMVIVEGGKIVVAGFAEVGLTPQFAVARYLVRGGLDRTFGTKKGYSLTDLSKGPDTAYGIAEGPGGQLLTCGLAGNRQRNDWGLARYGAKGRLDGSFSGNGRTILNMGKGFGSAYGCAALRSGKIVVVGRGRRTGKGEEFAVARLKANGSLDGTFGKQGKAYADFFDGNDTARDLVIQSNGKIVVVGDATERSVIRMGMARFVNA
jgi:uncharacterized delta-60 repeat protein